jgi:hypothetical protein
MRLCVGDLRVIAKAGNNAANLRTREHRGKDDPHIRRHR